jgi:hypothetical protein
LDAPYNLTYEGPIIAANTGFVSVDDLEEYKKTHVSQILSELTKLADGKVEITESDISFEESDVEDMN